SKARDLKKFADEDIAASLMNMTGEVIGTVAYLNALLVGVDKVYFVGRVSLLESVTSAIDKRLELAGVTSVYIENREFANAIGSLSFLKPDR
ncbi:pantothenate kinase, partial [Gammaproteobacteria bacterium]|nr:pantothenate kinase [Gammaproteobacteria bacterium]